MQYRDLTGQPAAVHRYRIGVRWIDEFHDPRSAWHHIARHHISNGDRTPWQWVRSMRGVRAFAVFASDDPKPLGAACSDWRGAHGDAQPVRASALQNSQDIATPATFRQGAGAGSAH